MSKNALSQAGCIGFDSREGLCNLVRAMLDRLYILAMIALLCAGMIGLLWLTRALQ